MNPSGNRISILGCGWLGFSIAAKLANSGFSVNGSSTQSEKLPKLSDLGIRPFHIKLTEKIDSLSQFLSSDILLINIPPGTKQDPGKLSHIKDLSVLIPYIKASSIQKIIYTSSTSIYPDLNRSVVEEDVISVETSNNKVLYAAEEMIRNWGKDYVILRLGGLTGYDRFLLKYFSGKKNVSGGNSPVNLLHRDDAVNGIVRVMQSENWNETYNFCSPVHPSRKEFYESLSRKYNRIAPEFSTFDTDFKTVAVNKFIGMFNYSFLFPDPIDFTYSIY